VGGGQLDTLLQGIEGIKLDLGQHHITLFKSYYRELIKWNRKTNLTSIVGYQEVQSKHFLDSLSLSRAIPSHLRNGGSVVDIGSGAGFPSIPLKIIWPELKVSLIESTRKKADFLEHIVQTLELKDVIIHNKRAETLAHNPELRSQFDIAVTRAVSNLATVAELTLPFCKIGGLSLVQKKAGIGQEISDSQKAISILGGKLEEIKQVNLKEIGEPRWILCLRKLMCSPNSYPRRVGVPAKRPIA
jgi:16S rRNA (guanine527-N7)-methyltransferase